LAMVNESMRLIAMTPPFTEVPVLFSIFFIRRLIICGDALGDCL